MIKLPSYRTLAAGFLVSLGLNALAGGLALSHFNPPPPPNPWELLDRIAAQLPPADSAILRSALDAKRPSIEIGEVKARFFPQRLRTALLADPFNPNAFATVFEEGRDQELQLIRVLVEAATRMSPEGRRRWATARP